MSEPQYDAQGNPIVDDTNGIKALRKAMKEKSRENEELKARLEALEKQVSRGSVADELSAHGLDPRVARFYPSDKPTTADAVAEWVSENRELFNASPAPQSTTLSPVELEGYDIIKKIQAAEAHTEMDFKSRLDACQDEAEVMALLAQFGQEHAFA